MRGLASLGPLACLLLGSGARAEGAWTESFEAIRQAAAAIQTVEAGFVQHKSLQILARPLVSEGRFAFRAPDSIRWEYLRPVRSVLLMDRGKLSRWVERGGAWQPDAAGRVEAMRVVVEEIRGWLAGRFLDSRTFRPRLLPGPPARVELSPIAPELAGFIQRIVLTLAERPGEIAEIEIVEGPDATTVLRFEQPAINAALPAGTFDPPR